MVTSTIRNIVYDCERKRKRGERDGGKGLETPGEEEKRVTSVAEQYPCCLVPLNPSSGTGAKALCQDVTTRDSTTQPPMGHHYPDLAAHSGYDSISRTRFPGYTPTLLSSLALFARKREKERVVGPANWHVWVHHLHSTPSSLSFHVRPTWLRDTKTRHSRLSAFDRLS